MGRVLDAWESQKILSRVLPYPPSVCTDDVEEAVAFAEEHYPVVLKAVSKDIVHKTDVGGVYTNVRTEDEVEHIFYRILRKFPSARVLVQAQVDGVELFLGAKRDNQFGPVVLFGVGGVHVEVYNDVAVRAAPFDVSEAVEMMNDIKGAKILRGYRGRGINREALARLLSSFSEFFFAHSEFTEIDVNPLIAGRMIYAVDARISTL